MAHIVGTAGDDTGVTALVGTNDADQIEGLAGNDTLYGKGGNDTLDGGTGVDRMYGGAGDDTYVVDNSSDVASEQTVAGIDDGGITDTVQASVSYHIGEGIEKLVLTGSGNINATGNASDNTIIANAGNNVLNGGIGGDIMYGLAGDDAYFVDNAGDLVIENNDDGTDKVVASVDYTLTANVENLTLAGDAVRGTGNALDNVIVGTAGDNILQGGGGNDTLNGGSGADTMSGGIGNDLYYVNDSHDTVIENAGEGTDTVQSSLTRTTLAANVENLTLIAAAVSGTGNGLGNVITGNAGANVLEGMGGADTLDGGTGADRMLGGAGNDTYVVDNAGDRAVETHDDRHDDGGHDLVRSSVSFQLGAFVEDLTLTGNGNINGFGNNLANVLTGNAGNNILSGGSGGDRMSGGAGNDTYVVENIGDVVIENANEGTDMVLAKLSYTLTDNVENLQLGGTGNFTATGNGLNNTIIGNAGNNILTGGAGADHMFGGAGNDSYIVDSYKDVVSEARGAGHDDGGIDTVYASSSFALGAFIENLTLTGTGNFRGIGNDLDNTIIGTIGKNLLDGGLGADTMTGGAGNDTYVVDNAGDVVVETIMNTKSGGVDLVMSSVTYTLGANLENLTLTGTANISATGNDLGNIIHGNSGNNHIHGGAGNNQMFGSDGNDTLTGNVGQDRMDGGAGDDIMAGGSGDDRLTGGSGADIFRFREGDGHDTIVDFSSAQGDEIQFQGDNHVTVTQSGSNVLVDLGEGNTVLVLNAFASDVRSSIVIEPVSFDSD